MRYNARKDSVKLCTGDIVALMFISLILGTLIGFGICHATSDKCDIVINTSNR